RDDVSIRLLRHRAKSRSRAEPVAIERMQMDGNVMDIDPDALATEFGERRVSIREPHDIEMVRVFDIVAEGERTNARRSGERLVVTAGDRPTAFQKSRQF